MCFVADARHYATPQPDTLLRLRCLAALNRINALACIRAAGHGWLGASYSACEVLTTLYFGLGWRDVVLSKGHAAALQYACLHGLGIIDRDRLLTYQDGPGGLQAHTDRRTPGVLVSTGSLGQALSKVAALAFERPDRRHAVVLGDGELQEGQCHEAFQTVTHRDLRNLVVIVDENRLQTALPTDEVKRIASRRLLLEGLGFEVAEGDGHDPAWLLDAIGAPAARPRAVIARTRKAGGSDALAAEGPPARWHAEVPGDELSDRVVAEQVARAGLPALRAEWAAHVGRGRARPASRAAREGEKTGSTGRHFARRLEALAAADPRVVVLDGDLAGPCGLDGLAATLPRGRFFEMGIAEQDMASFAGGLALAGLLPVVNTYAAFYKRAVEQISLNLGEGAGKVVYAGHYAGLGYYTDGATHQSLNDLGLMRALPGLVVVDPVDRRQTEALVDWALGPAPGSVYFRLRRIGAGLDDDPALSAAGPRGAEPCVSSPLVVDRGGDVDRCFVTTGPLATRLALDAVAATPALDRWGLAVQSVFGAPLDLERYRALFARFDRVITVEDGSRHGGLHAFVCALLQDLSLGRVAVRAVSVEGFGPSFRSHEACCAHHGFVPERVRRLALDEASW